MSSIDTSNLPSLNKGWFSCCPCDSVDDNPIFVTVTGTAERFDFSKTEVLADGVAQSIVNIHTIIKNAAGEVGQEVEALTSRVQDLFGTPITPEFVTTIDRGVVDRVNHALTRAVSQSTPPTRQQSK